MRKLNTLNLTVLSMLASAPLAHAQDGEPTTESLVAQADSEGASLTVGSALSTQERIRVGGFIGGNYLSSDNELGNSFHTDQVPGSGFMLGGRVSYLILDSIAPNSPAKPRLSAELETKLTFSSTEGGGGRESVSTPILGWRGNALLDLFPRDKVIPFALVGMGGETVFGSNKFMTSPDTDFAAYIGGGARYVFAEQLDIRADLRLGLTASRDGAAAGLSELHVGLDYSFGRGSVEPENLVEANPDDLSDAEEPEVLDSDRDGIPDDVDTCPDLAEIRNGIDDTDGCPEVDSDNDGLLGSKDQCPAAAEDLDGFGDDDGCPDPDNDADGRPDVIDQCPGEAENLNGFEDDDGCPDEIPVQVQQFTGAIEGIVFRTASARILRKSRTTLDKAFRVLSKHKSVRIEISGHTDDQGSAQSNRSLSRKRADYVKWYLVDKGIGAERITTVGYGPDKPVGDNATQTGRQLNRRIEFRLLPGSATVDAPSSSAAPRPAPEATKAPAEPAPKN